MFKTETDWDVDVHDESRKGETKKDKRRIEDIILDITEHSWLKITRHLITVNSNNC